MNNFIYLAVIFLILQILVIIRSIDAKEPTNLFWFCNIAPFLFAVGFLIGSIQFVKSLISIGLFPQIYTLFTIPLTTRISEWKKGRLWGGKFYLIVGILIHFVVIVALVATINIAPKITSLGYSTLTLSVMFFVTVSFAPKKENINSVYGIDYDYEGDKHKMFKLPYHTRMWLLYAFLLTVLTFIAQYALYLYL